MNLIIKQYSEVSQKQWDDFVYSNSMGWAYFLYDLIAFDWFSYNKNLSFVIVDNDNHDEIIMMVQLHEINKSALRVKLNLGNKLFSRWGYILKDNLTKKQIKKVKQVFEEYIDNYISEHRIRKFAINLPPLTDKFILHKENVNPLIYFNFFPGVRYTYVVDLSKPQGSMLADCEETTRQIIRKFENSCMYRVIEATSSEEDCLAYIKLHKETYFRTDHKKHILSDDYHKNMFYKLIPQKVCRVFFLVNQKTDEKVAAVSILIHKDTAYYWWGCSKNDKEIGVNKYLLFKVMNIIKDSFSHSGYFETGGAHIHLRGGKEKGLSDFKKCFGTFLIPIFTGEYCKK